MLVQPRTEYEDRRVLIDCIFPYFAKLPTVRHVLFVGIREYTRYYGAHFTGLDYWTIDPDVRAKRWAGRNHVQCRLQDLSRHFPKEYFELIICNGVYGWGLNKLEDVQLALSQSQAGLSMKGYFVWGWNDVPQLDPAPLAKVDFARHGFEKYSTLMFGSRYRTGVSDNHTYDFYQRVR